MVGVHQSVRRGGPVEGGEMPRAPDGGEGHLPTVPRHREATLHLVRVRVRLRLRLRLRLRVRGRVRARVRARVRVG